jgi:ABC-type multidrug transport system fused ATPase/permease subunit
LCSLEPSYHDIHPVGVTTAQLSSDATLVKDFSLTPITSLLLSAASLLTGVTLSLVYMWPLALVSLATLPIMAFATEIEMKMTLGLDEDSPDTTPGGNVLAEVFTNIRTVYALELQEQVRAES